MNTIHGTILCYSRVGRGHASRALRAARPTGPVAYCSQAEMKTTGSSCPTPRYVVYATAEEWAVIESKLADSTAVEVYRDY